MIKKICPFSMDLFTNLKSDKQEAPKVETGQFYKCGCKWQFRNWALCPAALTLQKNWINNLTLKASMEYMEHFKNDKLK